MTGVFSRGRLMPLAVVGVALVILLTASMAPAVTRTTLVSFEGGNGSRPHAELIVDDAGRLYGTTWGGGVNNLGTIFMIDLATGDFTTLASFSGVNGSHPLAGLTADAVGNLYGTTEAGGTDGLGTVFKLDSITGDLLPLVSFNDFNGRFPFAGLVADASGSFYGTTARGGTDGLGTVFKLDPITGDLETVVSFSGVNGRDPYGDLVIDDAGNLYGTTRLGGIHGGGSIFKLDTATDDLTTLVSFDGANGADPRAGLVADASGNLYGATYSGGVDHKGTVFRIDMATGDLMTLMSFSGANGHASSADLIIDANGVLFGTTIYGGQYDDGTIFKLDPATGEFSTLVSFANVIGTLPTSGLVADANGNLYGAASAGGLTNRGVVYALSGAGFVVVPEPAGFALLAMSAAATLGGQSRTR